MTSTITALRSVRIDVDGTATRAICESPDGCLEHLQQAVGGYVDVVTLHPTLDMWVDEEGIVKGLPLNPVASLIAIAFGAGQSCYFGPAVFTGGIDDDGMTLSLDDRQISALIDGAAAARAELRL